VRKSPNAKVTCATATDTKSHIVVVEILPYDNMQQKHWCEIITVCKSRTHRYVTQCESHLPQFRQNHRCKMSIIKSQLLKAINEKIITSNVRMSPAVRQSHSRQTTFEQQIHQCRTGTILCNILCKSHLCEKVLSRKVTWSSAKVTSCAIKLPNLNAKAISTTRTKYLHYSQLYESHQMQSHFWDVVSSLHLSVYLQYYLFSKGIRCWTGSKAIGEIIPCP
jgi:hypothetical protein